MLILSEGLWNVSTPTVLPFLATLHSTIKEADIVLLRHYIYFITIVTSYFADHMQHWAKVVDFELTYIIGNWVTENAGQPMIHSVYIH